MAVALSRTGEAAVVWANVICALTALSCSSIIPLFWFGLFTARVMILGAVLFPLYSLAVWFGARYFSRAGKEHYRTAALAAPALMGVITLMLSAGDYFSA